MTVADLILLYDYSYWANEKLFPVIERLTDDAFTRPVAGSYGSVRNTLVHLVSTEWGWMERCGGPARGPRLQPSDFPTPGRVVATWREVAEAMRGYLETLTDADLAEDVTYPGAGGALRTMPRGALLHHAANHAVHHRGQVVLLLRELGHAPGNVDLLFYHAERLGVPAW